MDICFRRLRSDRVAFSDSEREHIANAQLERPVQHPGLLAIVLM